MAQLLAASACATTGSSARGGAAGRAAADSAARAALAGERAAADASRGATPTLAVTPFRIGDRTGVLGALSFALADLITTDLSRSAQLTLVERSRLADVLRELDLAGTGRVDSATAPRAGRLLRADQLVLGALDSLPSGELRLGVRLADVRTGVVTEALDARAPLADILAAEKALVFRLFASLGVALTPAERAAIESRPATNIDALTAFGRGIEAEWLGDPRRATDEFQRALQLDPSFVPAGEHLTGIRAAAQSADASPALVPHVLPPDRPVSGAADRLNRPLDLITSFIRPLGGPADASFPGTVAGVLLTIRRP